MMSFGLFSPADAVRRLTLARDLLHDRLGALTEEAEAQESDHVDHAGDDAEHRRQSSLQTRHVDRVEGSGPPCSHDFDRAAPSPRLSMTTFGTIKPKLIAKMIVTAVMASEIVAARSSRVVFEPLVSSTSPLVILKRKTPGIIDTTAAKPMAANGMCQRRATGVRISPTTRHATNAPIAAPKPMDIVDHLRA